MSAAAAASAFREIGPQRIPELEQLLCLSFDPVCITT